MTLGSSRAHAQAIVDLLTAAGLSAHLSTAAKDAPMPYVVVHPSSGEPAGSLGARFDELTLRFQTTVVAVGPEQALWQGDLVAGALLGAMPVIPGRVVHPVWLDEPPGPVYRDDDRAAPIYLLAARWALHTSS